MPEQHTAALGCADVEQQHLADRYVLGQLSPAEAEAFEDHYMTCQTCVVELENAELRVSGFKRLGAAAMAATDKTLENNADKSEVMAQAKVESESEFATANQPPVALDDYRQNRRRSSIPQPLRKYGGLLAAALAGAVLSLPLWQDRSRVGDDLQDTATSVFHLQALRSAAEDPSRRLRLSDPTIILALELTPPFYATYRASLEYGGQRLWSAAGLTLGERDTLSLRLPRTDLDAGDYVLILEGSEDPSEGWDSIGRFPFSVEAP